MKNPTLCDCNSGQFCFPLKDRRGIFLCYVCDKCMDEKLKKFRPDILEQYQCDEPIEPED